MDAGCIPYRAQPDGARPCEAFDIRDARMGMVFLLSRMTGFNLNIKSKSRERGMRQTKRLKRLSLTCGDAVL